VGLLFELLELLARIRQLLLRPLDLLFGTVLFSAEGTNFVSQHFRFLLKLSPFNRHFAQTVFNFVEILGGCFPLLT